MEKSIEEKAAALGVPVIQPVERKITFPESPIKSSRRDDAYKAQMVEAICGGCGREVFRWELKGPCGKLNCPFGYNHLTI